MAKKKTSRKTSKARVRKTTSTRRQSVANNPPTPFLDIPGDSGLDSDLHRTSADNETTGRMMIVNLNLDQTSRAGTRSMVKNISKHTGLGTTSSKVCSSSDFGTREIDSAQADSAELVMLEDLGIALLNGDVDQNSAAESMATASATDGYLIEPEYVNYALGFDSDLTGLISSKGNTAIPSGRGDTVTLDVESFRALLNMLGDFAGSDIARTNLDSPGLTTAATECFDDDAIATWGLHATKTLESNFTGAGIRVAVLDTGMDSGHADFLDRNIIGAVFVPASGADNRLQDVNGHGTHCIGTSCGPLNSNFGPRYGVAHQAEIFAGKVLAHNFQTGRASGGDFGILRGIQWAISNQCEIISMSLGGRATAPGFPQSYETAARKALENGSLIIAATGNDSRRPGSVAAVGRPANCPSIVGVAAVDRCMEVAWFSNSRLFPQAGAEVNFSGPGVNVLSSVPRSKGNTGFKNGTSMATPHVAGLAALIAEETGLRSVPLYRELRRRVLDLNNRDDFGHGLVLAKV